MHDSYFCIVARLGISTVKVVPAAFLYDNAKGRRVTPLYGGDAICNNLAF